MWQKMFGEAEKKRSIIRTLVGVAGITIALIIISTPLLRQFAIDRAIDDLRSADRTIQIDAARRLHEYGERTRLPLINLFQENTDLQTQLITDEEVMKHLNHVLPNDRE